MTATLPQLDQAPPLTLPLRFFIAGLLWLLPALLALGWSEGAYPSLSLLIPLHLFTLGVLGNIMLGALLQLLAVLSGWRCSQPGWWTIGLWGGWQLGTLSLITAFLQQFSPFWLQLTSVLFTVVALHLATLLWQVWRLPTRDGSSRSLRMALLCLLLTLLLGGGMLQVLTGQLPLPLARLLVWHRLLAQGWVLLLIMAVAQSVAPLFLMTPPYPPAWQRHAWWGWPACLLLAALSMACWPDQGGSLWAWFPALCFCGLTWQRLQQTRRHSEWLLPYWRLALGWLSVLLLLWPLFSWRMMPDWLGRLLGWGWLCGLALTLILGMLHRIVPFLLWLDLKNLAPPRYKLPSLQDFISEQHARRNLQLWLGVQTCALCWIAYPLWGRWLLAASLLLLWGTLLHLGHRAGQHYHQIRRQLPVSDPTPA